MSERLLSIEDVADMFGINVDHAKRLAKSDEWPHLRIARSVMRFEPEQVEQIKSVYRKRGNLRVGVSGQTSESRKRTSA